MQYANLNLLRSIRILTGAQSVKANGHGSFRLRTA